MDYVRVGTIGTTFGGMIFWSLGFALGEI